MTSFVRALGLAEKAYKRLLALFHSDAFRLTEFTRLWHSICMDLLSPNLVKINGRPAYVVDGVKVPKEGRRMPGVKMLHQESANNSKAEYIMGHSCQLVSVLAQSQFDNACMAVPIAIRIHEGVVTSNRDKRTQHNKFLELLDEAEIRGEGYFIADPYYANKTIMNGLQKRGMDLITRMKTNTVGYFDPPSQEGRRGRRRKYGESVRLTLAFQLPADEWETVDSPLYDDREIQIRYLSLDLLWKPIKRKLRFVLVIHPTRGRWILASTDLTLEPIEIIKAYGKRFKIEVGIKEARHTVGVFDYHFWMKDMDRKARGDGDDHLHHQSREYRQKYHEKISAYHRHMQTGIVAQGVLQYLALTEPQSVWNSYGSWLRTMRKDATPAEGVVAQALRDTLPAYAATLSRGEPIRKLLNKYVLHNEGKQAARKLA